MAVSSETVTHGQHVCGIVGSSAERARMVSRFVRSGLQAGDRVWCFPNSCRPDVLGWLHHHDGIDDAVANGQLTVAPIHESVLGAVGTDPTAVIDGLRRAVDDALDSGWKGFRLVGDLGWATRSQSCTRQLLDFETRVGDVLDGSPAATLCQYDRYRFDTGTMVALAQAHAAMVGLAPAAPDEAGLSCTPLTRPGPGLRLAGEVDLSTHETLRAALDGIVADDGDLYLDLSDLTFIDNAGARMLAQLARRLAPDRRLVLHQPPQSLTTGLGLLREMPNLVVTAGPGWSATNGSGVQR